MAVGKDASEREQIKYLKKMLPKNCPKCNKQICLVTRGIWYECNVYSKPILVIDYGAPRWKLFFETSGCLTHSGYKTLKTSFETWAKGFCMDAINVLSNLISPSTYDEMMKLFVNKKLEGKGVKNENFLA